MSNDIALEQAMAQRRDDLVVLRASLETWLKQPDSTMRRMYVEARQNQIAALERMLALYENAPRTPYETLRNPRLSRRGA
jgi:hypothetical protein